MEAKPCIHVDFRCADDNIMPKPGGSRWLTAMRVSDQAGNVDVEWIRAVSN